MPTRLQDRIKFYEEITIFLGNSIKTKSHAHHALEIVIGLENPLEIRYANNKTLKTRGAIVRPDASHGITCGKGLTIFVYIDPESNLGSQINGVFNLSEVIDLDTTINQKLSTYFYNYLSQHYSESNVKAYLTQSILGETTGTSLAEGLDTRVQKVISHIKNSYKKEVVNFQHLVALTELSQGRLMHLFKDETGITIRKYILWCRMQKAIELMAKGSKIKEAANSSGFADSSHFNRTFVSMFGINPSEMIK